MVCWFLRIAITKYNTQSGLNNRNVLSHSSRRYKSNVKVLVELFAPKGSEGSICFRLLWLANNCLVPLSLLVIFPPHMSVSVSKCPLSSKDPVSLDPVTRAHPSDLVLTCFILYRHYDLRYWD